MSETVMPSRSASTNESDDKRPLRYTAALANRIEERWQREWEAAEIFRTPNPGDAAFDASRPKFYVLDMFPYPSGAGLHVGHPEGYIATDIVARFKRMRGFNVLHPMGFDAFGLPAEQYAIATGVHPAVTTRDAIDNFTRQLKRFGFSYDWSRVFATIDPDYYRWTQWIWLKAYNAWYDESQQKARPIDTLPVPDDLSDEERRQFIDDHRLAYLAEQTVNWCPKLGTVLANEEVIDSRSERGGFPVYRMPLKQWMFRITAYAERLLRDLDALDWPESTRTMQREWIGRSEGAEIEFEFGDSTFRVAGSIAALRVFTTRPDTIFGATYVVVAPEHPLVAAVLTQPTSGANVESVRAYVDAARHKSDLERQESKEKSGVFTGVHAINPATGAPIPIWIADYVLISYGTGAIMAVPGQDDRDWEFAEKFDLPIVRTVQPPDDFDGGAFLGDGPAVNSANEEVSLNGLHVADAKRRIIEWIESTGIGKRTVNYKLRDWLFSRQRYWGEPFPVVFDAAGQHYPVSESALPVTLPDMDDYKPIEAAEPQPPLGKATPWVYVTAGEAGVDPRILPPDTPVRRETNTMPGWAGSCWYYLRFCDPKNDERFCAREAEAYWMAANNSQGVDLYVGGAEHAVLHLLYARFWHKILFDLGEVSTPEPMQRLFHQGMIVSHAFQRADKTLVPVDEIAERAEGEFYEIATGEHVEQIIAKMSKSLKNVVNPDDIIAEFGADTFRLYEMFMGPLADSKPWSTRDIQGPFRFLQRAWRLAVDEDSGELRAVDVSHPAVERELHRTIRKVGDDIERLSFNTAIAAMMEFVNAATQAGGLTRDQIDRLVRTLAPFAPHFAEELWSRLGHEGSIAYAAWPDHDASMLIDDEIEIPVQIMGKVRARVRVPATADEKTTEQAALADPDVRQHIEGRTVRKVVVVRAKIVNIVVA